MLLIAQAANLITNCKPCWTLVSSFYVSLSRFSSFPYLISYQPAAAPILEGSWQLFYLTQLQPMIKISSVPICGVI